MRPPPASTLFPYTTLFRSYGDTKLTIDVKGPGSDAYVIVEGPLAGDGDRERSLHDHVRVTAGTFEDRKSTRLNSSHMSISYAVFCLKKKKKQTRKVTR